MTVEAIIGSTDGVKALAQEINREFITLEERPVKPRKLPPFTVATPGLPDVIKWNGHLIYVTDAAGGSIPAFSDGTNWRRVDTRVIVS